MISNLNLDIEILHIEIDLNMLFLIFIEYKLDRIYKVLYTKKRGEQICLEKFAVISQMSLNNKLLTCTMQVSGRINP